AGADISSHAPWQARPERAPSASPALRHCFSRIGPKLLGQMHNLHRYLHAIERIRIPRPTAGQRGGLVLLARHRNRNMLAAGTLVVGGVEAVPARAGDVDFGPGMRGAMLALAHLDVAGDEARAEAPI